MAGPKSSSEGIRGNDVMDKIVSLCKRRGFIYQSSEIYGGINGFWDYGPLGAELKRNIKELWWNDMIRQRDDVVGLEATIIMHPQIWKASGHVDTFMDMMVECPLTNRRFRADQVEPQSGTVYHFKGAVEAAAALKNLREISNKDRLDARTRDRLDSDEAEVLKLLQSSGIPPNKWDDVLQDLTRTFPETDCRSRGVGIGEISVLVRAGEHASTAWKRATEFYRKQGLHIPFLEQPIIEQVKDSTAFNPENGVKLSAPRPFNLMFKTYVGPVDVPPLHRYTFEDPQQSEEWFERFNESQKNVAYLRPETAQAIFAQFKNVLETSRQKVPFGIAQVGKAFRNEVTPRNYTFRSREFEQMELEYFIKPDEAIEAISGRVAGSSELDPQPSTLNLQPTWGWEAWHKYWVEERIRFYESVGLPRTTLVEYWQKPAELAHYAKACVDILYKFPFSKRDEKGELMGEELEGIAARGDFDLSQHQRFSGKPMIVFDEELKAAWPKLDPAKQTELKERYYQSRFKYLKKEGEALERADAEPLVREIKLAQAEKLARADAEAFTKGYYVPHVIEPSAGVDRLALALICNAYAEDQAPDEKGKMESRVVMRFHPRIAPIKVAVFPLLKNRPELVKKAREVRDLLRPHMNVFYDDAGAIGRRYRRQDEAGTPFGVTIDFDTLGEKRPELQDTVTLRDRDTMKQERVKIGDLLPLLREKTR